VSAPTATTRLSSLTSNQTSSVELSVQASWIAVSPLDTAVSPDGAIGTPPFDVASSVGSVVAEAAACAESVGVPRL
jgi:hypothetical protein